MIPQAKLTFSPLFWQIFLILVLIAGCAPVCALNPNFPISEYLHTSWGGDYALGSLRQLTQTPDGYLWIATSTGLVRFDGVRFTRYAQADGLSLDNSDYLMVDSDGSLWVATYGGVIAHLQSGIFHAYSWRDGLPSEYTQVLYRDSRGVLWVGTRGHGIFRMVHDRFEKVSLGIPPDAHINGFVEDSAHSLWISSAGNGVFRLHEGGLSAHSVNRGLPSAAVNSIYRDRSGNIWTVGVNGMSEWNGTRFVSQTLVNSVVKYATQCTEDRDGNLWIGSSSGLFRVRAGNMTKMDANSGLSADFVLGVYEDRQGDIWAATAGGLDRLRDSQIQTVTRRTGLFSESAAFIWPVSADRTDGVWIASGSQVVRIGRNGIATWPLTLPSGSEAHTILFDPGSGLLVGTDKGLIHWSQAHGSSKPEFGDLDVRCLFRARDGSLWIGTANRGLLHWKSYPRPQDQLDTVIPDRNISTLTEDRHETMWAGSHGGGLYRIAGQNVQHFGPNEGLRSSNIYTVYVDLQGDLWIGSAGGLSWFQDERIRTVSSEQGLQSDLVTSILEDRWGRLWFLSQAIGSIDKKSLTGWAAGRASRLIPTYYPSAHGLVVFTGQRTFPNAAQSLDGHLWFGITYGFAEVTPPSPERSYQSEFPVFVEDVTIDGISHFQPNRLHVNPGARSIEIRYTAIALSNSDTLHFRYRLDGIDDSWIDADNRRFATYNDLKPGVHTFRVEATAGEDRWVESSPMLLEQAPFFYQTGWFLLLVSAMALSILLLAYRVRLRLDINRIQAGFQQRMDERTRIARELHDTLLQSFQGAVFQFQAARRLLLRDADNAMQVVDEAIRAAEEGIREARTAIQELRPEPAAQRSLPELLNAVGGELAAARDQDGHAPSYRVVVEGKQQDLLPMIQDEVYRISREVLRNAFAHADASGIEVEIRYDQDQLRLRFRDDGKGIDPKILKAGGQPGHWGIPGMRERAQRIESRLEFWSEAGAGTEVQLTIPASVAYEKRRGSNRFWSFHKAGSDERHS